ncbi:hypothetical protein LX36DRAFT_663213 [Colletotrichum falcatum]|nr:hypothetical protein LX36DRAFT_663213 [Colletotrichum falcatum]
MVFVFLVFIAAAAAVVVLVLVPLLCAMRYIHACITVAGDFGEPAVRGLLTSSVSTLFACWWTLSLFWLPA